MPKRIPTHRPRGQTPRDAKRDHDRAREKNSPWRKWYRTARWASIRNMVLGRDPYCTRCNAQGVTTPSTVANHIKPHKGDYDLFWDMENLEGVCAPCHNSVIQSEERRAQG